MDDSIKVKGLFTVDVFDNKGNRIEQYQDSNLVVTLGKTNAAKLLGGDAAGKKVSKIAVGTNATENQLFQPFPPCSNDSSALPGSAAP